MRIAVPLPVACVVLIKVAKESDCERRGEASSSTFIQHCALRARFRVPSAGGGTRALSPTQDTGGRRTHRSSCHSAFLFGAHGAGGHVSAATAAPAPAPRPPPAVPPDARARAQFRVFRV